MRKSGILLLAGLAFLCLALALALSCQEGKVSVEKRQTAEGFIKNIETAVEEGAMYFVAYRQEDGEPFAIIESPDFAVVEEGDDLSTNLIRILKDLEKSGEHIVETKCSTSYYVHGSPGCNIASASGRYRVVCPTN